MKTIAVIFGGKSLEHDISILTGIQVISNLKQNYAVVPIYIDQKGVWWTGSQLVLLETFQNFDKKTANKCELRPPENCLFVKKMFGFKKQKIDVAILALHGQNGEDGSVQGLFELCEIPYSGSNITSSAITMDKAFCKMILKQNNIPTPNFKTFFDFQWEENKDFVLDEIEKAFDFNVVIKPARAGSSIGVTKCSSKAEVNSAIDVAFCFDTKIVAEQVVTNFKEVNVACVGSERQTKTSVFEEVVSNHKILDFEEKYLNCNATRTVDKKFDEKTTNEILKLSKKAFKVCECGGVVRMDFFVTENKVMLNEINSIPGSMANYLFKDMTFSALCDNLIELAEQKFLEKQKLITTYHSNALSAFKDISNSKIFK